jgi:kynurenine formamidase
MFKCHACSSVPRLLLTVAGVFIVLSPLARPASGQDAPSNRNVDLSYAFGDETIYWPTELGFRLQRGPAGVTERGYYYAANRFEAAEHGGTHMDAPRHFSESGQTVDQIPLSRLVGPATCVDVSAKCLADRDYLVTVEDFLAWEEAEKAPIDDRIVVIRTGFGRHWPDREKYLGTKETGAAAVAELHFPGLDPSAAEWLVSRRRIRMVAIDTASIDYGQSRDFSSHVRLARAGVPVLENLANAERLPSKGFSIAALPMKIAGGSGAPCRVVAILAEQSAGPRD